VEYKGKELTVTLPGTGYSVTYFKRDVFWVTGKGHRERGRSAAAGVTSVAEFDLAVDEHERKLASS